MSGFPLQTGSALPGAPAYNMTPANFPNWRKGVANARSNAAASYILCIGTSITAGNPALTTPGSQAIPALLTGLCAAYLAPSQLTLIALTPSLVSNSDARFNFPLPANWTSPGTPSVGWADVAYFHAAPSAANLIYTPGSSIGGPTLISGVTPNSNVDTFACITANTSLTGTLGQSFTGVAGPGYNTHSGTGTIILRQPTPITGTRGTGNTLTLSTAAANAAFPVAIDAYDSTQAGLRFGNVGVPLLGTSAAWATSGAGASIPTIEACSPTLSLIELGADDAPLSVSPGTYQNNLVSIIQACQTTGDVLLWTTPANTNLTTAGFTSQYNAVEFAVAAALGCGLVDIGGRFGPYTGGWGTLGLSADGTHPNALGCWDIAGPIFSALSAVVG